MVSTSWPCDVPASASQSAGFTGISLRAQPPFTGLIDVLDRLTELKEMLSSIYWLIMKDILNYTDKQPDEEICRTRSGRVPRAGASVLMELGCTIILAHGWVLDHLPVSLLVFNCRKFTRPCSWAFYGDFIGCPWLKHGHPCQNATGQKVWPKLSKAYLFRFFLASLCSIPSSRYGTEPSLK